MTKKHLAIVAAAALTVGSFSFVNAQDTATPAQNNSDRSTAGNKVENAAEKTKDAIGNAAEKTKDAVESQTAKVGIGSTDQAARNMSPHAAAIHNVLANVAESAFSKNGIKEVADNFTKADRDRLDQGDALKSDDTYDGRIAELQKDWKAKYNASFNIRDEDAVLNQSFASIDESSASDAARTASGTLSGDATPTPPSNTDATHSNAHVTTPDDNTGAHANVSAGDTNVTAKSDSGRDTATVHIPASHGLAALDVPMVHETMGWRIDVPDTLDSAKLKSNMLTAMTDIDEKKDQWPADKREAMRFATHRVLLAIFDKPAMDAGVAAPGATDNSSTPAPSATPGSATPNTSSTPDANPTR